MSLHADLRIAAQIAQQSGRLLLEYFGTKRVSARAKGRYDVVTAADTASEDLILDRLRAAFPGDGIIAEEGSEVAAQANRRWYLDPLDGTFNYSRGVPFWCVSLARFQGDEPSLGVVHDPIRDETFCAARGLGAWCNEERIRCSAVSEPSSAVLHLTVELLDDGPLQGLADLNILAPQILRTRNIGSAALALAYVAAGRFDAMMHRFAHTWDLGAGMLLVQEAGGCASDVYGGRYTEATSAVLAAATPPLHSSLLQLLHSRSGSEN
jgi:myo-inositol-1(or 4)-monophosphatase